ncbi:MAG: cell division ATP-binding protein FtsE [Deltaproteobacteria bacterium]|nr:cell division ATP-binding protein FtsE [Deltaproteobacteria bacterium]
MIQFYQVNKSYGEGHEVFHAIDLHIDRGEFVFLTGKSGSGKTTLMKMIFCQERPNTGQIVIDGRNVARMTRTNIAFLRRTIGVVFQDFKLINSLNVFENIAITLKVLGLPKTDIQQKVTRTLSRVGLERFSKAFPLELSGGEQQRVAIARALVNDPKILLADEPTGNLDPSLSIEILELFQNIHIRGTTILMATHEKSLVERANVRELHIDAGRIVDVEKI